MSWRKAKELGYKETAAHAPVLFRPKRLLQNHDNLLKHLQIVCSVIASVVVLLGLAWIRDGFIKQQYVTLAIISGLLIILIYHWLGVYRQYKGLINTSLRLCRSWCLIVTLTIVTMFVTKTGVEFSRTVIMGWAVLGYAFQLAGFLVSYKFSQSLRHNRSKPIRAVVVGSHWVSEHLVESITENPWMPDRIVGIVDSDSGNLQSWGNQSLPYLGSISDLTNIIDQQSITRVYIALPTFASAILDSICKDLTDVTVDVVWVPDIFAMSPLNHSVKELNGLTLITLSESPMVSQSAALSKGIMDKIIGSLALVLLSPLMLVVALLVRTSSSGPIFFKQQRHGWDEKVFDMWKFRSMYMHDDAQVRQATRYDSRITPIGRFIRRTSIDELPQLFNVLQGNMSLVGPRPHAIEHNNLYAKEIQSYMRRHRIKPGMTGLAQINGLRGETDTLDKMLRRVEFDLEYINKWSIWLDWEILMRTPFSLLCAKAY